MLNPRQREQSRYQAPGYQDPGAYEANRYSQRGAPSMRDGQLPGAAQRNQRQGMPVDDPYGYGPPQGGGQGGRRQGQQPPYGPPSGQGGGQQPPAGEGGGGEQRQWRGFTNSGGEWGGGTYNPNAVKVGDYVGQLEGFNTDKLNDSHEDSNTLKYVFARAASNVDVKSPGATQKVVDNLRAMGVNASVVNPDGEADRILFGDTGESIDVMRGGANVGQDGWQWIDAEYGGQPAEGGPGGPAGPGGGPMSVPGVSDDPAVAQYLQNAGESDENFIQYLMELRGKRRRQRQPSGGGELPNPVQSV